MSWLISDFSIFGWHIQHWPLIIAVELVILNSIVGFILSGDPGAYDCGRAPPQLSGLSVCAQLGRQMGDPADAARTVGKLARFALG